MTTLIDNEWLRVAFLASGLSASELARRLDWEFERRGKSKPDDSRVRRTLGLVPSVSYHNGKRYASCQRRVHLHTANEIASALGIPPYAWATAEDGAGRCITCGEVLLTPVDDKTCGFCRAERTSR